MKRIIAENAGVAGACGHNNLILLTEMWRDGFL
jgi:hypothetical protein